MTDNENSGKVTSLVDRLRSRAEKQQTFDAHMGTRDGGRAPYGAEAGRTRGRQRRQEMSIRRLWMVLMIALFVLIVLSWWQVMMFITA